MRAGRRRWSREFAWVLVVVMLAGVVSVAFDRRMGLGVVAACLPLLPLMLSRPAFAGVVGAATLPFSIDLLGEGPVRLSLPDLLLMVALLGTLALAQRFDWLALRPLLPFVVPYAVVLLVAVAAHLDAGALVNGAQRLQILVVPLVVGSLLLRGATLDRALSGYIIVATTMGLAFSAGVFPASFLLQKNPVGQFLVGALLVVVAHRGPRWHWATVPFLAYSLFQTQSRGALLGLALGIAALLIAGVGAHRARTALLLMPVVAVLGLTYKSLPDDVQHRALTFSGSDSSDPSAGPSAQYTIKIRQAYRKDALRLIASERLTGVGISHYLSGDFLKGTLTNDPHNVLLLEGAEGGLPLLGGFLLLVVGSSVTVWRRRRDTPLAALALAVQVSTIGHGCVDIYWVRGTPVLGWLLVGAALADAHRRRSEW